MVDNQKRVRVAREEETREFNFEFNVLDIPKSVKNKLANEQMALQWVRHSVGGDLDWMNLRKHEELGWVAVTKLELPEMQNAGATLPDDRFSDNIVRGDLVLMKCPQRNVDARKQYFHEKAQEQEDAVNVQLRQHSKDSRAPISNSSRSSVKVGERAKFDA